MNNELEKKDLCTGLPVTLLSSIHGKRQFSLTLKTFYALTYQLKCCYIEIVPLYNDIKIWSCAHAN